MRGSLFFMFAVACANSPSQSLATGEVGTWEAAAPLPTARANHCSAAVGEWVVVIGGNRMVDGAFTATDEVHAARVSEGVLGPWQLAGRMPSAVTECAATSDGQRLFVVDGIFDNEADSGGVWTAELDEDGMLGAVTRMGALPGETRALSTEATVRGGELIVMDTLLPTEGDTTVTLRTPLAQMSWTTSDWDIGFRAQSEYAFSERYAYTLGGYHDAQAGATSDVFVAAIDGSAAPRATTPLPKAVGWGEAVVVDDWLFIVGGRAATYGAAGTTDVFSAPIGDDGSVGAWTSRGALPMARTNHELALVGDYLVVTGGASSAGGDANVLVSQVRWSQSQ